MALGSDLILNLPSPVHLLLKGFQLRDTLTHAFNGDQAERTNSRKQDRANKERGKKPRGVGELPPDQVDERLGHAWVETLSIRRHACPRQSGRRFAHHFSHLICAQSVMTPPPEMLWPRAGVRSALQCRVIASTLRSNRLHHYRPARNAAEEQCVFLDQMVLSAGDELIVQLQNALVASQAGVLVWTQASDSDWVRREYQAMEQAPPSDRASSLCRSDWTARTCPSLQRTVFSSTSAPTLTVRMAAS